MHGQVSTRRRAAGPITALFRAIGAVQVDQPICAVLAAYGFDPKRDPLAELLSHNSDVAAREKQNLPVTAPGVPPTYPDPARLVTDDCIRP